MKAEYSVLTSGGETVGVNPKLMETKVLKVGKRFLIKASAVCEKNDLVRLTDLLVPEVRLSEFGSKLA